jgi:predicted Zn-dependent protease
MTTATVPLTPEDMRLIAEIGFMGTQSGQLAAARALFEALKVLRPQSTLPHIGLAMAALGAEKPDDAVRILRDEGLKQHPGDAELTAFLGLALHAAGRAAEASKVLTSVVQDEGSAHEPCVRMARKLLTAR